MHTRADSLLATVQLQPTRREPRTGLLVFQTKHRL